MKQLRKPPQKLTSAFLHHAHLLNHQDGVRRCALVPYCVEVAGVGVPLWWRLRLVRAQPHTLCLHHQAYATLWAPRTSVRAPKERAWAPQSSRKVSGLPPKTVLGPFDTRLLTNTPRSLCSVEGTGVWNGIIKAERPKVRSLMRLVCRSLSALNFPSSSSDAAAFQVVNRQQRVVQAGSHG